MKPEDRYDSMFQYYTAKAQGVTPSSSPPLQGATPSLSPPFQGGEREGVKTPDPLDLGADWLRAKAQVKAESAFNPNAVSPAGAEGLAQFMKPTFREWAKALGIKNANPFNPEHSIACQAAYMAWLLKQVNGSWIEALAAYNWGIGNLRRHIAEQPAIGRKGLPRETQNYISKVERFYEEYKMAA